MTAATADPEAIDTTLLAVLAVPPILNAVIWEKLNGYAPATGELVANAVVSTSDQPSKSRVSFAISESDTSNDHDFTFTPLYVNGTTVPDYGSGVPTCAVSDMPFCDPSW